MGGSRVPKAIEASNRPLPIGFWKGSGLALMLDLLATLLSGGKAAHQVTPDSDRETMLSQVFIALNPAQLDQSQGRGLASQAADQIIEYFRGSPHSDGVRLRYPGQRVLNTRKKNLENGVPVDPTIWQHLQVP
jgi:3-dehydro-L-gulonate 2-dehydrogenase